MGERGDDQTQKKTAMRMGGLCQDNTDDSVENTPQGCKEEEKTSKAGQTVAGQDKTGERLKKN